MNWFRIERLGRGDEISIVRRHVINTPLFKLYWNTIFKDDLPDEHDHPYHNVSIPITGYYEYIHGVKHRRYPFIPIFRKSKTPHRLKIKGSHSHSLFMQIGKNHRIWGYYVDGGWVDKDSYLNNLGGQTIQ